jgi:WD40 repeat protein
MHEVGSLTAELGRRGVPTWWDQRDIPVSVPWLEEIRIAIEAADIFVVCDSPSWRESQNCLIEREVAADLHKTVVTIDVRSTTTTRAADQIKQAYDDCSRMERIRTQVLALSSVWERAGRPAGHLLRGDDLNRALNLRQRGHPLTPTARAYLRASSVRTGARAVFTSVAVRVVAAGLVLLAASLTLRAVLENAGVRNAEAFQRFSSIEAGTDVFSDLAAASAFATDVDSGWLGRFRLIEAFGVVPPTWSSTSPGERFVGLGAGHVVDEPVVIDDSGLRHPDSRADDRASSPSQGTVRSVAASDDGTTVAVAGTEGSVVRTADDTTRLPAAPLVAVSPDGSVVAYATDELVRFGQSPAVDVVQVEIGAAAALAATAEAVVIGGPDGTILVQPVDGNDDAARSRAGTGERVNSLQVSSDGKHVAVAFDGQAIVRVFSLPDLSPVTSVAHVGVPSAVAFSPNGRLLAIGGAAGISIVDVRTGVLVSSLRGAPGSPRELAWQESGERVWALSGESRLTSWHWRTGHTLIDDPDRSFVAVAGPAVDGRLSAVSRDGRVSVIDPTATEVERTVDTSARHVVSAALAPDGRTVALGSESAILMHHLDSGEEREIADDCPAHDMDFSPVGEVLYVACFDRGVRGYATESGRLIYLGEPETDLTFHSVLAKPDGTVLAGDSVGDVHTFTADLSPRQPFDLRRCRTPVLTLASSADGDVYVASGNGGAAIGCTSTAIRTDDGWKSNAMSFDAPAGRQSRTVAVHSSGLLVAAGLSDGSVHFWQPATSDPNGSYHVFGGEVRGVAFGSGGEDRLVVASWGGLVESLPACPLCISTADLNELALEVLHNAEVMGLR